jgi:Leucine Rich repeat
MAEIRIRDGVVELAYDTPLAAIKRLVGHPRARTIRVFRANGCPLRAVGAKALAAGQELVGLVELDLDEAMIDDAAIAAITAAPQLRTVERLVLTSCRFGRAGLRALLAPGVFPKLRELAIDSDALARGGLELLLASDLVARLVGLDLASAQLADRHAVMIAKATRLARLVRLSLAVNDLGPAGAKALAASRGLTRLTHLDLGHNILKAAGIAALAKSPNFGGLVRLSLSATFWEAPAITALAKSRAFGALRELDLSANQLGDAAVAALGTAAFPKLVALNLDWNELDAPAAAALVKRRGLTELILSNPLDDHGIGDAGAQAIAAAPTSVTLARLDLTGNRIGDAGARALAASRHLRKLRVLDVKWNMMSRAGVARIVARFGKRAIVHNQRKAEPEAPLPPPLRTVTVVDRKTALGRLAKKRGFASWRPSVDAPIRTAAEAIRTNAIGALLAQGKRPTVAADRGILKKFIAKFDALDRVDHFIGTIEVEDLEEVFEALRGASLLAGDEHADLFDEWRDF